MDYNYVAISIDIGKLAVRVLVAVLCKLLNVN